MIKTLEITVRVGCPVDCSFCPQSKIKAEYAGKREFTVADFEKCLASVPRDCRIDFSGFTEPLIHHDIVHMIGHAKRGGHEVHLYTTLVGGNPIKFAGLGVIKPSYVKIHVPDQTAMVVPDDKWIELHRLFRMCGMPAQYMAMGPMTPLVSDHLERLGIQVEMPTMINRAGNLDWLDEGRPIVGPVTCNAERYTQNVLLPDGTVVGCCCDYSMEVVLGNLMKEDYWVIHGRALAWSLEKNPSPDSMCRKCSWAKPI
jgi:radical SAM protein with 4Fe4S-binding SPASM domain